MYKYYKGCVNGLYKCKKKDVKYRLPNERFKIFNSIEQMKDYIICEYNNLITRDDIVIGDDEFLSQIKDWDHVHRIYLKRVGKMDFIKTHGKVEHIGYCDIEKINNIAEENEMANPMELHVGDIVTIATGHPKASTADVANRVGVIMSIEYIPEDDQAVYQIKDEEFDTYTYTANELYAANVNDKNACIRRLICKE